MTPRQMLRALALEDGAMAEYACAGARWQVYYRPRGKYDPQPWIDRGGMRYHAGELRITHGG